MSWKWKFPFLGQASFPLPKGQARIGIRVRIGIVLGRIRSEICRSLGIPAQEIP